MISDETNCIFQKYPFLFLRYFFKKKKLVGNKKMLDFENWLTFNKLEDVFQPPKGKKNTAKDPPPIQECSSTSIIPCFHKTKSVLPCVSLENKSFLFALIKKLQIRSLISTKQKVKNRINVLFLTFSKNLPVSSIQFLFHFVLTWFFTIHNFPSYSFLDWSLPRHATNRQPNFFLHLHEKTKNKISLGEKIFFSFVGNTRRKKKKLLLSTTNIMC